MRENITLHKAKLIYKSYENMTFTRFISCANLTWMDEQQLVKAYSTVGGLALICSKTHSIYERQYFKDEINLNECMRGITKEQMVSPVLVCCSNSLIALNAKANAFLGYIYNSINTPFKTIELDKDLVLKDLALLNCMQIETDNSELVAYKNYLSKLEKVYNENEKVFKVVTNNNEKHRKEVDTIKKQLILTESKYKEVKTDFIEKYNETNKSINKELLGINEVMDSFNKINENFKLDDNISYMEDLRSLCNRLKDLSSSIITESNNKSEELNKVVKDVAKIVNAMPVISQEEQEELMNTVTRLAKNISLVYKLNEKSKEVIKITNQQLRHINTETISTQECATEINNNLLGGLQ